MLKIRSNQTQVMPSMETTTYGPWFFTAHANSVSAQCNITVDTPSNPTFIGSNVSLVTGTITSTAHGLFQGQLVTLTTTGSLPTGLSTSTTYYVIYLTANTFQLASTAANALAGTPIVPTGAGTGTNTVVVTALAGGSVQLQKSNDGVNPVNDGSSVSVAATGTFWLEKSPATSAWMRVAYNITSGSYLSNTVICVVDQL